MQVKTCSVQKLVFKLCKLFRKRQLYSGESRPSQRTQKGVERRFKIGLYDPSRHWSCSFLGFEPTRVTETETKNRLERFPPLASQRPAQLSSDRARHGHQPVPLRSLPAEDSSALSISFFLHLCNTGVLYFSQASAPRNLQPLLYA